MPTCKVDKEKRIAEVPLAEKMSYFLELPPRCWGTKARDTPVLWREHENVGRLGED